MGLDFRDIGCVGGDCPFRNHCVRYLERAERQITLNTPPYNKYEEKDGVKISCGYKETLKEEEL